MSASRTCDNCGATVAENHDDTLWWLKVGWAHAAPEDVCSIECARAWLDEAQSTQWEFEMAPAETDE